MDSFPEVALMVLIEIKAASGAREAAGSADILNAKADELTGWLDLDVEEPAPALAAWLRAPMRLQDHEW